MHTQIYTCKFQRSNTPVFFKLARYLAFLKEDALYIYYPSSMVCMLISFLSHMDLQLGLALPTHNPIDGFELNNHHGLIKSKQIVSLESAERPIFCCESKNKHHQNQNKKRSFEEFVGHSFKRPSQLLVWSGQPSEEDDRSGKKRRNIHTTNKNNEEESHVVGWPPIKSWRKRELHQQRFPARGQMIRNDRMQGNNENRSRGSNSNSLFVKVKMEGVAMGRKIDLRLYNSYQTLTKTLIAMFAKYQKLEEDGASYTLTFQNERGDWLLARHVPWQSFIGTAQRLEISRN